MAAWGCSVVGIGFVSSIWLIRLIVEEDPVSRMSGTLSKDGNLPKFHSIDDEDSAMGRGNANRALLRWHIRKRLSCRGSRAKNMGAACARTRWEGS